MPGSATPCTTRTPPGAASSSAMAPAWARGGRSLVSSWTITPPADAATCGSRSRPPCIMTASATWPTSAGPTCPCTLCTSCRTASCRRRWRTGSCSARTSRSLRATSRTSPASIRSSRGAPPRADADDADAFDGCVVFDEAHRAKNLVPQTEKTQGRSTGSKTAEAVTALQAHLPNGRVLYVSATAAAETKDLGYMTRLGLWGRGCTFPDFSSFATGIARAGVGAMELVAMDMKARGLFVSRMLSFSGCSFEKHECALSRAERELYDQAAAWWEELHAAFEECMQLTSSEGAARSFWSSHQSFFKQLLNSIKCRFAISEAQAALDRGECVVVGLLSTGEAKANEAVEREKRDGKEIESEVSTPHEIARDLLERHLPVVHHDSGLIVPAARTIKDGLLAKLEAIKMPGNALDLIISHFGVEQVAEMTGRKMRIITANGRTEVQRARRRASRTTG